MSFLVIFHHKEEIYNYLRTSGHHGWSYFAILPDFLGEINRFSLIFSFIVNLEQNVIETKIFVGKFYMC